ncbi:MAG: hypothetical protein ACRC35_03175 [Angustibacter sp.]
MDNSLPYPTTPHSVRVALAQVQDQLDAARRCLDDAIDAVDAIAGWLSEPTSESDDEPSSASSVDEMTTWTADAPAGGAVEVGVHQLWCVPAQHAEGPVRQRRAGRR